MHKVFKEILLSDYLTKMPLRKEYSNLNKSTAIDKFLSLAGAEYFSSFKVGSNFELKSTVIAATLPQYNPSFTRENKVSELTSYITQVLDIIKKDESKINRVFFEMRTPHKIKREYSLADDKVSEDLDMALSINIQPEAKPDTYKLMILISSLREEKYDDKEEFKQKNELYKKWIKGMSSTIDDILK
ncbi:MAG: hypothetical protein JSW73_02665 [Candidatus Woesearchaeota archaeon]|nr:MAG: hypothetical protein JSW73_02665 [Candidatus Woesearchaeota archaeon]